MSVELYINIFFFTLLAVVMIYAMFGQQAIRNDSRAATLLLVLIVLGILSFRPIDHAFGDTPNYARRYKEYVQWGLSVFESAKDWGFGLLTLFMARFNSVTAYFAVIACIYVLPVYYALRKGMPQGVFVAMLLFVCSFSFWGYGVNGLRNGMATSLVLAAFFCPKWWLQVLLMAIGASFHGSALLPIGVFWLARLYHNPKTFLIIYATFLVISLAVGPQLGPIISGWEIMDNTDNRLQEYLGTTMDDQLDANIAHENFSRVGFRWDFMLYSLVPIVLGYIYIFRLGYKDRLYRILYCTYVGCNACWLLTTYVPFNNRFAYLSWFIYPVVMSYPLLKDKNLVDYQQAKLQLMVLLNYSFTLFMHYK